MLTVFSPVDTSFDSNGDIVVNPLVAIVHKVDNGDYYLELETGLEYVDFIKDNNIVVCPTPQGSQPFRISSVEKTGRKISAKCLHIFYDALNYVISDSYVVEKNCQDALIHLNNATDNESPFSVSSDVSTIASFRCVRKSLNEAIFTVLERWGGHLVRDGFNIAINNTIGADNGVTIQYKKNLKEITVSYDWSEVVTKALPVGKDGYTLDELYLYSPMQYDIPFTKVVSFEQDINEEDYPDEATYKAALRADLIEQCTAFLSVSQYPAINYSMAANMDEITDVGDLVEVYDERIGVAITASVLSFEYNAISGKYENIEFGTPGAKLSDLMSDISAEITTAVTETVQNLTINLQAAIDVVEGRVWSALTSSYCVFNGSDILILDSIPIESATNCIKIDNKGVWISSSGAYGSYSLVWSIEGEFDASAVEILNLTADSIRGGVYKVGSNYNTLGVIEIYGEDNTRIGTIDKDGLLLFGKNGESFVINESEGVVIYDSQNNKIFYTEGDTIHIKKSAISQELTIGNKLRMLPVEVYSNGLLVNDGIGFFSAN